MAHTALFTSNTEEWETPPELFRRLNRIYEFKLDACASATNAKCRKFFTREDDALGRSWAPYGRVWLNPPYGRAIAPLMAKACQEAQNGALVVALVPARTDTRWWHNHVAGKADVIFIRGRLHFLDA